MQDHKNIAEYAAKIALEASEVALQYFQIQKLDIIKKTDESPVTIADRLTEQFIRNELAKKFPDHGIFGEEYGISGDLDGNS